MKKTTLTEDQEKEIIETYKIKNISTEKLALQYKVGKNKINIIFKKYNIEKKKKGGQLIFGQQKLKDNYKKSRDIIPSSGKTFIAKSKLNGEEFNDHLNRSGCLSNFIKKHYTIEIPNNYYKRKYYLEHGKHWHEQWFDIIEKNEKETRKCMYCDWETTDIDNRTGCFENHLNEQHNKTIKELINEFPEEIKYHSKYEEFLNRNNLLTNYDNFIECKECGEKLFKITLSHLKKHNLNFETYKKKYGEDTLLVSIKQHKDLTKHMDDIRLLIKNSFSSKPETEIKNLLNDWGINYEERDKKLLNGHEIDILIPSLKLGIEYNGLLWHSENFGKKTSSFHINKTKICNNKGYGLIHIFSDEWLNNKDIVINKLKHILNISSSIKVGARKCIIKKIGTELKNKFLNEFHLQGSDRSKIFYGSFYNDILIGVMCFTNSRPYSDMSNLEDTYELTRYVTNSDYIISGLASKILKVFINEYKPKQIISFADRRWTININSNLYTKLGFKIEKILSPSYSYIHRKFRDRRLHKFGFGKSSLKRKGMYIDGMTEWECMQYHGYDRIWDCGLVKYKLKIN